MREFNKLPVISDNLIFCKDFLLLDDCQGTFNYEQSRTGGGVGCSYETNAAKNCLKGIQVATRDVGATIGDYCYFTRWLDFVGDKKVIFSLDFNLPDVSNIDRIEFRFYNLDDTYYWKSVLYVDIDEGSLLVHNSSNGTTELTGSSINFIDNSWIHIEITLDFFSNKYISVLFNGTIFDCSNVSFYDVGNPPNVGSNFRVMIVNANNAQSIMYIDNFIIRLFDV